MWSDLFLAPLVVMQRLPVLWSEAMLPHNGRPESERMVREKISAAVEGSMAAQIEIQQIWMQAALGMMAGNRPPSAASSTARLARAALRPSAKRVRANARRLAKAPRSA